MLHSAHRTSRQTPLARIPAVLAGRRHAFSRDGETYLTVPRFCPPRSWVFGPAAPHNGGMFLLLNLAVGGNAGEPPPETPFPVDLMIDYVRVSMPDIGQLAGT